MLNNYFGMFYLSNSLDKENDCESDGLKEWLRDVFQVLLLIAQLLLYADQIGGDSVNNKSQWNPFNAGNLLDFSSIYIERNTPNPVYTRNLTIEIN